MRFLLTADEIRAGSIEAQEEIGAVLADLPPSEEKDALLAKLEELKTFWRGASDDFALAFGECVGRAEAEGRL